MTECSPAELTCNRSKTQLAHSLARSHAHTHARTHTHTHTHTRTHARSLAHTHTHARACTHTHHYKLCKRKPSQSVANSIYLKQRKLLQTACHAVHWPYLLRVKCWRPGFQTAMFVSFSKSMGICKCGKDVWAHTVLRWYVGICFSSAVRHRKETALTENVVGGGGGAGEGWRGRVGGGGGTTHVRRTLPTAEGWPTTKVY